MLNKILTRTKLFIVEGIKWMNHKLKVLFIDSSLSIEDVIIEKLNESGYQTTVLRKPKTVLSQLNIIKPDIILIAVLLPELNGFELCKAIKKLYKTIPILFVTKFDNIEYKVKGFESGAVDYLTYPFEFEELLARINIHHKLLTQNEQLITLNNQLLILNEELSSLNDSKNKFFSIIAHDLRSIFNPLIISMDMLIKLSSSIKNDKINRFISKAHKSVKNAYSLLENLLEWSRSQIDKNNINQNKFDISELCKKNVQLLNEMAVQKNIKIISKIPSGTFVFADLNMINAVLRNLLSNAIKFTKQNGEVKILSNISTNNYEFVISDTGVGIPEKEIKKILSLSSKYKTKGTQGETGSGLGVILCKEYIEKNNGKIWVTSEINKGTNFYFTLPAYNNKKEIAVKP